MKNYEEVLSLDDDPRFGSIKILCLSSNPRVRVMQKQVQFSKSEELQLHKQFAERRASILDPRVQVLKHYEVDENNLTIKYFYQYLDEFLSVRDTPKEKIPKLFEHICEAIVQNEEIGQPHGDVRPELISFDSSGDYFLLQKKNPIEPIRETQRENVTSYKPVYMGPELFEILMKHKTLDEVDLAKNDLFSLGFLCLEAFEEHDFLQEFYEFNKGYFDFEALSDKLELITKRNLPEQVEEFIKFLQSYILVEQERRATPTEALDLVRDIQQGKKLFESSNPLTESKQNLQYYNPFDFVNTADIIPRTVSIDNRSELPASEQKLPEDSLIDINQNIKIHKSVGQNNYLVMTQSNDVQTQQSKGSDIQDHLENLKFFKLKLNEPFVKEPSKANLKGTFYPLVRKSQDSKHKNSKKQSSHSQEDGMFDYLQSIGIHAENVNENETQQLDKKIRETAKLQDIELSPQLKKNKGNNQNLRGFLQNSTQRKLQSVPNSKILELDVQKQNMIISQPKLQKEKSKKNTNDIVSCFSIVNQPKKKDLKETENQKRDKSARKLIMNNFNILENKPSTNIQIKKKSQDEFQMNFKKSFLSEDDDNASSSQKDFKQTQQSYQKQKTYESTNLVHHQTQVSHSHQNNQISTPKRNYQPPSLNDLNYKRTAKSHKEEIKQFKTVQNQKHPIGNQIQQFPHSFQQTFQTQPLVPHKVISVRKIQVPQDQKLEKFKSSNFINCYSDNFIQSHSQKQSKSYNPNFNPKNIYNAENLKERESWKQNQAYQDDPTKLDQNIHLYQQINPQQLAPQFYSSRDFAQPQKTLKNTIIRNIPYDQYVEDRQSTTWINSSITSQKNIGYQMSGDNYNFQKKHTYQKFNQFNYFQQCLIPQKKTIILTIAQITLFKMLFLKIYKR